MEPGNGFDKTESKTVSGGVTAPFEPIKTLGHVLIFVSGYSRPIIGDRNDGLPIAVRNLNGYLPRGAAMLNRVIDEIGDRIE
jgi:hypothetical protein